MNREYGIGRVPADVDPADELLAEFEAERIQPTPRPRSTETCSYRRCRQPATMNASLGPSCPDHYDELSG